MSPFTTASLYAASALLLSGAASAAHAQAGLAESVWHNIPEYEYTPTQADISLEQAWTANNAAAYGFTNTTDGFNYTNAAPTIAGWFGGDAAGAALSDTNTPGYFAFNAVGYINVTSAGNYTFNLGNTSDQIDDAARITVDGNIVAEQNFTGNFSDFESTIYLTAGLHSYDLFYFQTENGYNLVVDQYGPGNSPINFTTGSAVPEPASAALFAVGLAGLGLLRRRRRA